MKVTIPGKTFLIGEYAVLKGGTALIATHEPLFEVCMTNAYHGEQPFAKDSPAGKLYLDNREYFKNKKITFNNPYKLGGLGASTAEFLGVYRLLKSSSMQTTSHELLNCYWQYATASEGEKPSGADLIAQNHSNLCLFDASNTSHQTLHWPFKELSFAIIHTNKKLATHTHLKHLKLSHLEKLLELSNSLSTVLKGHDSQAFLSLVANYSKELEHLDLVATHTQEILERLSAMPQVLAAKGCGAMGADTIFILSETDKLDSLCEYLKTQGHPIIATSISDIKS